MAPNPDCDETVRTFQFRKPPVTTITRFAPRWPPCGLLTFGITGTISRCFRHGDSVALDTVHFDRRPFVRIANAIASAPSAYIASNPGSGF